MVNKDYHGNMMRFLDSTRIEDRKGLHTISNTEARDIAEGKEHTKAFARAVRSLEQAKAELRAAKARKAREHGKDADT